MKILEFLQKIGVLRIGGAAATYTSAKDAPDELITALFKSRKKSG